MIVATERMLKQAEVMTSITPWLLEFGRLRLHDRFP
jgi:hypothetical protein